MATPRDPWNATNVLRIENLFTCVGHAPSKGRKCRNPIAAANREWASEILSRMESVDVMTANLKEHLEELAPRILCKRYHQNQAATMVSRWLREVESLKADRMRQRAQAVVPSPSTSRPAPTWVSPSRSAGDAISIPRVRPRQVQTPAISRSLPAPSQQLPTPPTTPTRRRNHETGSITAPRPVPSTTPAPSPAHTPSPTPIRSSTPVPSTTHAQPPTTVTSPTPITPLTPVTTPTPAPSPPAAGAAEPSPAPIEQYPEADLTPHTLSLEECSICYEDIPTNTGISSECDHAFHASCINTWLETQDPSQARQCPYCRSPWTRQKVEGDCCICLDRLLHNYDDNGESDGRGESERELVWCKSRCGQNFHKQCMDSWLSASATRERMGRCPDCRADWVP